MPPKEGNRKKAWKPKTKTGCITCRIRRVKCDEAKPACTRCTSTGRKCDGYKPAQSTQAVVPSQKSLALFVEPSFSTELYEEREGLQFFQLYTAPEFSGFFDSEFWKKEVLLAAQTYPAIHHAITGLGAMHRKFIGGELPCLPDDASDRQLRFALKQCNRSIQEIVRTSGHSSRSDKITAMTACILFNCFACLQGHQSSALEHLKGGLKLLQEFDAEREVSLDRPAHPISVDSLTSIFTTLDIQARGIMSEVQLADWPGKPKPIKPTPNLNILDVQDQDPASNTTYFPEAIFETFQHARTYFEDTLKDVMTFIQAMEVLPPKADDVEEMEAAFMALHSRANMGSIALNKLMTQSSPESGRQRSTMITALRLARIQVDLFLKIFRATHAHSGEMIWDNVEPEFVTMIDLASKLLKAYPTAHSEDDIPTLSRVSALSFSQARVVRPVYSASFGLVAGCWIVAARSRNPVLRRKGIRLLLDYPRREGVWDSILAGRIAWEAMMLEEEAALDLLEESTLIRPVGIQTAADVPDHCRIRETQISWTGLRSADIRFVSVGHWQRGEPGWLKKLEW